MNSLSLSARYCSCTCVGLLCLALESSSPCPAAADWPEYPTVNVALCTAPHVQEFPQIASDGAGGAIVVWQDRRSGTDWETGVDIYAQHVLGSGEVDPSWPVNGRAVSVAVGWQEYPVIVSDGHGGAIIAWQDSRSGTYIYAQHVLASGDLDPAWPSDGRAVCSAAGAQRVPEIISDGAGGAIVAWHDHRGGADNDIYAQHLLASGEIDPAWPADGRAVCAVAGEQRSPKMVPDGAGGAIVTWEDYRSPGGYYAHIYAQRVLATGELHPAWPPGGRALCTAARGQNAPQIVSDGMGGAIVTWSDNRDVADQDQDIYAQRVLASGELDPAWPTDGRALCTATGGQNAPQIVSDGMGGAIVAWSDARSSNGDIYVQHITPEGIPDPAWTQNGVALCTNTGIQFAPMIAADGMGGAIVAWQDRRSALTLRVPELLAADMYAQHIMSSGVVDPTWTSDGVALCTAAGNQWLHQILSDGMGGAIVTWCDGRNNVPYVQPEDIYAQRVDVYGRLGSGGTAYEFVDATSGPLGDTGNGRGVAWGDYDNDGDLDLYLVNQVYGIGAPGKLFRNDGGGTFVDATSAPLGYTRNGEGVAWGDYDNDGDLDLYVGKYLSKSQLSRNDGGGTFVDVTSGTLAGTGGSRGVAWGDFDSDGDLDLYLANKGPNKLLRNDGAGSFADVTDGPLGDAGNGEGVAWVDYDNDGDLDLYLVNFDSANKLFRNDGGGTLVDVSSGPLGDTGSGMGAAWGDFDNDGDLDLYLVNWSGEANKLLRNDGGTFVDVTRGLLGDRRTGAAAAWGDYDNDGDLDLYLVNYEDFPGRAPNMLLRNMGGGMFVDATTGPLGNFGAKSLGVAWGDYDNDGDLDLYLSNDGSANKLLRNEVDAGQHWLQVKLEGTVSNWTGIGARVTVVAGGARRIREISGGSGFRSQDAMVASFGLGAATMADSVIVRWPLGQIQGIGNIAVDQAITLREPLPNRPPDCSGAIATAPVGWPPSHALAPVRIEGVIDPDGDALTITATSITQDEPLKGRRDSNTCADGRIDEQGTAWVRMERDGSGNGRVYRIGFTATDARGASSDGAVTVCVPHDHGKGATCTDDGQRFNSLACERGNLANAAITAETTGTLTLSLAASVIGRMATLDYALPAAGGIDLSVFDVAGRHVATVVHGPQAAGAGHAIWEAQGLPQGLYFARLRTDRSVVKKTLLVVE